MSDVYTVAVIQTGGSQVVLNFFNRQKAESMFGKLRAEGRDETVFEIDVEDDYGTKAMVNRDEVLSIIFQDLKRLQEGQAEAQLMQARAHAALQKKAADDPALRLMTPASAPNGFRMS